MKPKTDLQINSHSQLDIEEGFEEQKISIVNVKQFNKSLYKNFNDFANELISAQRPTDFLPRTKLLQLNMKKTPLCLLSTTFSCIPSSQTQIEKAQQKYHSKFSCLEDKYCQTNSYEMIYSKHGLELENGYLNSYIGLKNIKDYNPNEFKLFDFEHKSSTYGFESNFECGNLLYGYKKAKAFQFDLILQNDTNTRGYNQWFFFSFSNDIYVGKVRFRIVNLIKKSSLYSNAVRPVVFSEKGQQIWEDSTFNIKYYRSDVRRESQGNYYVLQFEYQFKGANDVTYFAMNIPYSYTKMIDFIQKTTKKANQQIQIQKQILCYTISNNALPLLKITHRNTQHKKIQVVIMARQHPAQNVGSHLLECFVDQLLNSRILLQNIQFIIIPMMNPDGVIYGNSRVNLSGYDLNRQWLSPDRYLHPEVYFAKQYISKLENLKLVLDFHGHSKKYGSFMYANRMEDEVKEKVFPFLVSRCLSFSLPCCTFGLSNDKLKTARANLNGEQIYTLQTSYFGFLNQEKQISRWKHENYKDLGKIVCDSIQIALLNTPLQQFKLAEKFITYNMHKFEEWGRAHNQMDYASDSNPSQDQLSQTQRQIYVLNTIQHNIKKKRKKKILRLSPIQFNKKTNQIAEIQANTYFVNYNYNSKDIKEEIHEKLQLSSELLRTKKLNKLKMTKTKVQDLQKTHSKMQQFQTKTQIRRRTGSTGMMTGTAQHLSITKQEKLQRQFLRKDIEFSRKIDTQQYSFINHKIKMQRIVDLQHYKPKLPVKTKQQIKGSYLAKLMLNNCSFTEHLSPRRTIQTRQVAPILQNHQNSQNKYIKNKLNSLKKQIIYLSELQHPKHSEKTNLQFRTPSSKNKTSQKKYEIGGEL